MRFLSVATIAVLVIGCSGTAAGSSPEAPKAGPGTIIGSILLNDGQVHFKDRICQGSGGYSDIGPNMNVTVKNEKAEIIGTGNTGVAMSPNDAMACELEFTVKDLPNASFYSIGTGKRGELTYSRAEMDAMGWTIALTIGNGK